MLYITTTATLRPEILEKTYESFFNKMLGDFKDQIKVIINIDPVGPGNVDDIVRVVRKYFVDVLYNIPYVSNFAKAFKWTWDNVNTDDCGYVLNLEDDWELLHHVDLMELLDILNRHPNLALLRLGAFHGYDDHMKNWGKFFSYNGEYYPCPEELRREVGFCGHPSLIKSTFIERTRGLLIPIKNPEKQFHHDNPDLVKEVLKWQYGVYGVPNQGPLIKDIGRKWMEENGYLKSGNKAYFTCWEKKHA